MQKQLFDHQITMNKSLENKVIKVLVENKTKESNKFFGRSEHMTSVIFDGNDQDVGNINKVNLNNSNQNTLFGESLEKIEKTSGIILSNTKKDIQSSLKFVYSDNNSLSVIFHENDLLIGVVGEFNKNLKELEKITGASIYSRGNSILIKSHPDKNEIVKNAIQFLANQFINNGNLEQKDILSSVDKFMINEKVKNSNVTDIIKTPKKSIIPRSEKQKEYVRALRESEIIISAGPAGTGKTFLAVAIGLTMLLEKIERIILSRPAVEAGERLGFLPGDMKEKVDPYLRPLYDSLYDLFHLKKYKE